MLFGYFNNFLWQSLFLIKLQTFIMNALDRVCGGFCYIVCAFFYHVLHLQFARIIQFRKNKKYNKTNTNKTQNLLKVILRF